MQRCVFSLVEGKPRLWIGVKVITCLGLESVKKNLGHFYDKKSLEG